MTDPEGMDKSGTLIERLGAAASWLDSAVAMLDDSEIECDSCHVKRKKNWAQAQGAKELAAMALKIRRWSARFGREQA